MLKIKLHINFVDGLERLHGSFKSNEGTSEGKKEDQPRGSRVILKGDLSTSGFIRKSREGNRGVSGSPEAISE